MQYSILINQFGVGQAGLLDKTDLADWAIISYLKDFWFSNKHKTVIHEGSTYVWVNYQSLLDSMPLLHIKDRDTLGDRFKKLRKLGLIKTVKFADNTLYFQPTELCQRVFSSRAEAEGATGLDTGRATGLDTGRATGLNTGRATGLNTGSTNNGYKQTEAKDVNDIRTGAQAPVQILGQGAKTSRVATDPLPQPSPPCTVHEPTPEDLTQARPIGFYNPPSVSELAEGDKPKRKPAQPSNPAPDRPRPPHLQETHAIAEALKGARPPSNDERFLGIAANRLLKRARALTGELPGQAPEALEFLLAFIRDSRVRWPPGKAEIDAVLRYWQTWLTGNSDEYQCSALTLAYRDWVKERVLRAQRQLRVRLLEDADYKRLRDAGKIGGVLCQSVNNSALKGGACDGGSNATREVIGEH